MIPREVAGTQDRYERNGEQALRDVRPLSVRLRHWLRGEASGFVLGGMAGTTLLVPAVFDLTLSTGLFYAAWVLAARVEAPIRLPRSARRRDWSDPRPQDPQAAPGVRRLLRRLGRLHRQGDLAQQRGPAPARHAPRHHRLRQDHHHHQQQRQPAHPGQRLLPGGRQGQLRAVRARLRAAAPLRPRRRHAGAEPAHRQPAGGGAGARLQPAEADAFLQPVRHRQRRRAARAAGQPARRGAGQRHQRRVPRPRGGADRHAGAGAGVDARPQGRLDQHREDPLHGGAEEHLDAGQAQGVPVQEPRHRRGRRDRRAGDAGRPDLPLGGLPRRDPGLRHQPAVQRAAVGRAEQAARLRHLLLH